MAKTSKLKEMIAEAELDMRSCLIEELSYNDIQELIKLGYEPRYDLADVLKEAPGLVNRTKIYISLKDKFIDITDHYMPRDLRAGRHFPYIQSIDHL